MTAPRLVVYLIDCSPWADSCELDSGDVCEPPIPEVEVAPYHADEATL
ncbi:MAG: hypothetical protein IPH07_24535 [Deltaproteobacteria bacterium]|nr:hypothetical protein [Deltaproteobacteria bacterium]